MPNWCINHIELSGPREKIEELYTKAKQSDELLEHISPIGAYNRDTAINQWGTKWDINPEGLDFVPDGDYSRIEGYFESAWSPPTEAVHTWLENNPECDAQLYFYEPAMDFAGSLDSQITLSEEPDDYFTDTVLGEALDSHFGVLDERAQE